MKKWFVIIAGLAAAVASSMTAYFALQARASTTTAASPKVAHSASPNQNRNRLAAPSAPSSGINELARRDGLDPTSLKRLVVTMGERPAAAFGASKGTSACVYLTGGTGAVGGCMQLGDKLLAPRIAIVDGGTYVWGLASSRVDRVQARTTGSTVTGSVTGGLFAVEIADGSHGSGPIDLIATTGSLATTIALPGIPTPVP